MTGVKSSNNQWSRVYTINNPESVIEVFVDADHNTVKESKSLNYNRYKEYTYSIKEYLSRYAHHAAGKALLRLINASHA